MAIYACLSKHCARSQAHALWTALSSSDHACRSSRECTLRKTPPPLCSQRKYKSELIIKFSFGATRQQQHLDSETIMWWVFMYCSSQMQTVLDCVFNSSECYLGLAARDRAAHDEAMPPHPSVPLWPYSLDLHILKPCFCEPLQQHNTYHLAGINTCRDRTA